MKDNLKILIMKSVHHQRRLFHELVMTNKHGSQALQNILKKQCSYILYIKAHFNTLRTGS